MYVPFAENIGIFAVVGLAFAALYLWWYRRTWTQFYDPYFTSIFIIGLSTCFVTSVLYVSPVVPLTILAGLLTFLAGFRYGLGNLNGVLKSAAPFRPSKNSDLVLGALLAFGAIALALDFWVNVRPALGTGTELGGARYLAGANNRFLSIFGYAARPLPLFFFWLVRSKFLKAGCVAMIAYDPLFSILMGGKSAIFTMPLKLGAILYFKYALLGAHRNFAQSKWERFFKKNRGLCLTAFAGVIFLTLVVTPFYITKDLSWAGYQTGFTTISQRFLLGFDSALMAIQFNMAFPSPGLNLIELWFGAPLKVLGLFHGYWNGINQFVAIHFMMLSDDATMQFPNNFIVLEIFGSIGWIAGIPLLAILSVSLGKLIQHAARNRASLIWAYWFGYLSVNPVQMLIDGQSFFNMMMLGLVMAVPLYFFSTKATGRRRVRFVNFRNFPGGPATSEASRRSPSRSR